MYYLIFIRGLGFFLKNNFIKFAYLQCNDKKVKIIFLKLVLNLLLNTLKRKQAN